MTRRLLIAGLLLALSASTAWAQVATDRTGRTAVKPRVSKTIQLLNKLIPEVAFEQTPLEDALDFLEELTGVTIRVRWQVLEDAGVMRDDPISLKATKLPFSQILWMIMQEAGGPDLILAYRASGNIIIFSTEEDLGREMLVKIYDVRDMLISTARFQTPEMDPGQAMQSGGSGGGGGSQLFTTGQTRQQQQTPTGGESPELDKIKQIIMNTIEPDSWAEVGGKGTIYDFNGMLIIYNTPLVHQQIAGFVEEELFGP